MEDSKDKDDSEEKTRRKKYLLTVAPETSQRFEQWAEDEGFVKLGRANTIHSVRRIVRLLSLLVWVWPLPVILRVKIATL